MPCRLPLTAQEIPAMMLLYVQLSEMGLLKRLVFGAWKDIMRAAALQESREEAEFLRQQLNKQADSIWHAPKARLVQMAMRELGFSSAEATGMRVGELRYRLKRHRDASAESTV